VGRNRYPADLRPLSGIGSRGNRPASQPSPPIRNLFRDSVNCNRSGLLPKTRVRRVGAGKSARRGADGRAAIGGSASGGRRRTPLPDGAKRRAGQRCHPSLSLWSPIGQLPEIDGRGVKEGLDSSVTDAGCWTAVAAARARGGHQCLNGAPQHGADQVGIGSREQLANAVPNVHAGF
jgi:hypothetical protein